MIKWALKTCIYNIVDYLWYIRVIPQGTVDNNLVLERLAGPKALDPNYCKQPTLWLYDLCLEVLYVHGNELRLYGAKAFSLILLLIPRLLHSSSIYVFSYEYLGL